MAETEVTTNETTPPSLEQLIAQQRRRLEEARKTMQKAAEDPGNREALNKGNGHGGGACLHF